MFKLADALLAVEGRREFSVKRYDGLVSIDYQVTLSDSFDGIRANFRGIVFDEITEEIISLPLHKFYNVNQTAETQFDLLKDCTATIYEKADGSLIHAFKHPIRQEILTATRASTETPQAKAARNFALQNHWLTALLHEHIDTGWTPIFEYVAPNNQIVVFHKKPRLIYLISRNRRTGEYWYDDRFEDKTPTFSFPFADIHQYLDKKEFEGYVCHLSNGMIVKCKTPWYMERHRAVDALMRPKYKLYGWAFEGVMDDIIAIAPDQLRPLLIAIYDEAQQNLLDEKLRLEELYRKTLEELGVIDGEEEKVRRYRYVRLVQDKYAADFGLLMDHYSNKSDIDRRIQDKLCDQYRIKYPGRVLEFMEEA